MKQLSPAGHVYDRKIPPPLPANRMLTRTLLQIPLVVDLRQWAGPTKDQSDEGACTGHAFSSAIEWIMRRYLGQQPILSPQFFYASELIAQGNFPDDEGSDGVTGSGVAVSKGCCEATLYPYVAGQILRPTAAQLANALHYAMGAYHGVAGSQVALSVLGDPVPWPIEVGFTVYESFESAWKIPGVMPIPQPGEKCLGGHEVAGTKGYDIEITPTLRPAGCPPAVLIQNSWGTDWGLDGDFWMPLEILDAPDTDIKVVHAGHPWKA